MPDRTRYRKYPETGSVTCTPKCQDPTVEAPNQPPGICSNHHVNLETVLGGNPHLPGINNQHHAHDNAAWSLAPSVSVVVVVIAVAAAVAAAVAMAVGGRRRRCQDC